MLSGCPVRSAGAEPGSRIEMASPRGRIEVVEVGGPVSYSAEMRVFLRAQSADVRARIVAEIEYRARARKSIRFRDVVYEVADELGE